MEIIIFGESIWLIPLENTLETFLDRGCGLLSIQHSQLKKSKILSLKSILVLMVGTLQLFQ